MHMIFTLKKYSNFIFPPQVEQQDQILTQLQQELRAERERHQETARQYNQAKKINSDLQEDIDNYNKSVQDLTNHVSQVSKYEIIVVQLPIKT